jgi:hypothetical protein
MVNSKLNSQNLKVNVQNKEAEIYTLTHSNDLYFHLVKVTNSNIGHWNEFASKHQGHAIEGTVAFRASLKYYNNIDTEIWVAYAASKPFTEPNEIDEKSIEMFTTVATSKNSAFTSHMGITRSVDLFQGIKHKGLSLQLHSFAAYIMQERYPEKKYMIHTPVAVMREILFKAFYEKNIQAAIHIGDKHIKHEFYGTKEARLKSLFDWSEKLSAWKKAGRTDEHPSQSQYNRMQLEVRLLDQKEAIEKGINYIPITINAKNFIYSGEFVNHYKKDLDYEFILKDKEDKVLLNLNRNTQNEEFKWFFNHPNQITDTSTYRPLITIDLDKLSTLKEFDWEKLSLKKSELQENSDCPSSTSCHTNNTEIANLQGIEVRGDSQNIYDHYNDQ